MQLDNWIPFTRYITVQRAIRETRRDFLSGIAINATLECWIATSKAMNLHRDNDTSVIRGPVIMKAGRLDSYGAAQQAAVW